jgi:hypothetical protein
MALAADDMAMLAIGAGAEAPEAIELRVLDGPFASTQQGGCVPNPVPLVSRTMLDEYLHVFGAKDRATVKIG